MSFTYEKSSKYPVGGDVNRSVPGDRGKDGPEITSNKFTGSEPYRVKENAKPSEGESQYGPYGSGSR